MSRDIKFRVWDKSKQKMYQPDGVFSDLAEADEGEQWAFIVNTPHPDDCELMQYTGLKDKNGKEIYEGDIIEHRLHGRIGAVVYDPPEFCVGNQFRLLEDEYHEVIGNIYENPELQEAGSDMVASDKEPK